MVTFALEREHRIGPCVNCAVNHPSKMHAEERELRIRNRINQTFDEMTLFGNEFEVFTPERNDFRLRVRSRGAGDPVTEQSSAIDHHARLNFTARSFERWGVTSIVHLQNAHAGLNRPAVSSNQISVRVRHCAIAYNSGRRHLDCSQASDVWLNFAHLLRNEPRNRKTILQTALVKILQSRELCVFSCDDNFAANLMLDAVLAAKFNHRGIAFASITGLVTAWFVVNAGMNDATVPAGLVRRQLLVLLDDKN